jgi:hypothetical protein
MEVVGKHKSEGIFFCLFLAGIYYLEVTAFNKDLKKAAW